MQVRRLKNPTFGEIYRYIYMKGGATRKAIAEDLKLSLPTVTNNLQELIENDYVFIDGTIESTGGRKAYTYKCTASFKYSIGLNITSHHLTVVLVDTLGTLVDDLRIRTPFEDSDDYYHLAATKIEEIRARNNIPQDKVLGVGISLPVIMNDDQKTVSYAKVVSVDNKTYYRIGRHIEYPYLMFNDANSAGLAEWWHTYSDRTAVYISLNPSIGGATINGRELYMGDNNRASEFGHITIVPGGRRCYCGKKGCVDAYCSEEVLTDFTDGNIHEFFEELPYNAGYRNTFDSYLYRLALAVNTLRICYDCDVIIGGNVGAHMGNHINALKEKIIDMNPFENTADYVKPCHYITSASAVGASLYFIRKFIQDL